MTNINDVIDEMGGKIVNLSGEFTVVGEKPKPYTAPGITDIMVTTGSDFPELLIKFDFEEYRSRKENPAKYLDAGIAVVNGVLRKLSDNTGVRADIEFISPVPVSFYTSFIDDLADCAAERSRVSVEVQTPKYQ